MEFGHRITLLRRRSADLSERERAFVSQLYQRRNQIDDDDLSEKQRGWLKGIERKISQIEFDNMSIVETESAVPPLSADEEMRDAEASSVSHSDNWTEVF